MKKMIAFMQGLSRATDISSSDAEIRKNGIKLLSGAIKVIYLQPFYHPAKKFKPHQ